MRAIRTSTELWPIVITTFDPEFTNEDLVYSIHEHTQLLKRNRYFVTIRDTRAMKKMPTAVQRRIATDWQEECGELIGKWCLGVATVSREGFMKSLLTAVSWISTPPCPEHLVTDMESAMTWVLERLAEKGVSPPEGAQAFVDRTKLVG